MPKRFTDSAIWGKEWFMDLKAGEKAAWFYIKDQCDAVGVWQPNFKLASFILGSEDMDWEEFRQRCNGNIELLPNGKWFLPDFCSFQYGEISLESTSKPIMSYVKLLRAHGLLERVLKPYGRSYESSQEKEKEKEKEKDKEKDKDKEKEKEKRDSGREENKAVQDSSPSDPLPFPESFPEPVTVKKPKKIKAPYGIEGNVHLSMAEYSDLLDRYGESQTGRIINTLGDYKAAKGKSYKSDMAAIRSWVIERVKPVREKRTTYQVCDWCGQNFSSLEAFCRNPECPQYEAASA
jgi:hypothetical protein